MATKYASIAHPPIKYSTSLLMKLWLTIYPNYFLHTCTNCLSIINTEKILINLSRICTLSTISPPKSQSLFSQSSNRKSDDMCRLLVRTSVTRWRLLSSLHVARLRIAASSCKLVYNGDCSCACASLCACGLVCL